MLRLLTALWALWFAVLTVGPGGFGACQEHGPGQHGGHGGHGVAAEQSQVAPAGHAAMGDAMADGMAHGASHEMAPGMAHEMAHEMAHQMASGVPADASTQSPGNHHCCTCLGTCCTLVPGIAPPTPALVLAAVTMRPVTPTPAYRAVLSARRVFSQPYAIGPPATSIA